MDNIDRYGHCCLCHRNLIAERVADGVVIKVFLPEKEETEFLLDDESRMRVCICRTCKQTLDLNNPEVQKEIMDCAIEGWRLETRRYVDGIVVDGKQIQWSEEQRNKHMEVYSKKNIVMHSENAEKHILDSKIKELREVKILEIETRKE